MMDKFEIAALGVLLVYAAFFISIIWYLIDEHIKKSYIRRYVREQKRKGRIIY